MLPDIIRSNSTHYDSYIHASMNAHANNIWIFHATAAPGRQ